MDKLDFVRLDKQLYMPKHSPEIVDVPTMQYLMCDGRGLPENNPQFQEAMGALYGIAYSIKLLPRHGFIPSGYKDFKVPPPEGLWWAESGQQFDLAKSEDWRWTLMLRMPDFVNEELVRQVVHEMVAKKKNDVYLRVRLSTLQEGQSVQLMHIGPYEMEGADLALMANFAEAGGYEFNGKHHEIYYGDPRRTAPEKLKTVLRQPIVPRGATVH